MRRMYDKEEIKDIAGAASINSIDLVVGEPTVDYNTDTGITIDSVGKLNGSEDVVVSNEIPIIAGDNISIDKASDSEKIVIKADGVVKSVKIANQVYMTGSNGNDSSRFYSSTPANYSFPLYSGAGTLRANDPTEALDCVNKQYLEANAALLKNKTRIPTNSDLNDYKTSGTYYIFLSSDVVANKPLIEPGTIFVTSQNESNRVFQLYIDYYGRIYSRYYEPLENKWTAWTRFAKISDIPAQKQYFRHSINFGTQLYFSQTSSNNLPINSITDLKTVFPDDVWMPATGYYNEQIIIALNPDQMKFRTVDGSEWLLTSLDNPTPEDDVVTL